MQCNKKWKVSIQKQTMTIIVKDYFEKSAKTLAVGEIQSLPVSQMMVAAVGNMANESPKMLLGITMTKLLACNLYIISSSGHNYKTDLTGPITFEHLNTSIYHLNDPKSLKEFCEVVAHLIGTVNFSPNCIIL